MNTDTAFSDYIVYVDESGDHNMKSINPENPAFVLAFCIFNKCDYADKIVPACQKLKFKFWGHDNIILHSRDIRKATGDFSILQNKAVRDAFLLEITNLMQTMPYTVIAVGIDKAKHRNSYKTPANPYELALQMCLERLERWLEEKSEVKKQIHLLFERRGKVEDDVLELEFHRIYESTEVGINRKIKFVSKQHNSTGLQFADLVAYPIARHVINPGQPNQAFDVLKSKLRKGQNGKSEGFGLKIFP